MAIIKKLIIDQFRNIENQCIEPAENINLITGLNAHGKTNLLEAIYYIGHNRSFKTSKLKEVIGYGQNYIKLSAEVDNQKLKLQKSTKKTSIHVDDEKIISTSTLTKILPIQTITPEKGFIVNGTPKSKRSYLDWGLFHVKPDLLPVFKSYNKALKNINALLYNKNTTEMDGWLIELSRSAKTITQNRIEYIKSLQQITKPNDLKGNTKLKHEGEEFEYVLTTGWPSEVDHNNTESICNYLSKNIQSFIKAKFLNCGPHKASIKFSLGGNNESFLSRGQQKKYSIIFWLAQVDLLTKKSINPIVIIDDMSSELDANKIEELILSLENLNVQAFITDIGHNLDKVINPKRKVFEINNGTIKHTPI